MKEKKVCVKCKKEKNISEYTRNKKKGINEKDIYRPDCKDCFNSLRNKKYLEEMKKTDPERAKKLIKCREEKADRGECPEGHKWCSMCKSYLPKKDFSKCQLDGWRGCRKCNINYQLNKQRIKKKKAIEYLGGKCVKCNHKGHYASFQFHHVNPKEKERTWFNLRNLTWERIVLELDKCIVLCNNCHKIIHCKYNDDGTLNKDYVPTK